MSASPVAMVGIFVACVAALNAYSYTFASANPLIQSDVWRYLDGFLGKFIEHGFSWLDVFGQADPADTNLPLHKLFLFFHTRYFGMDFRLEGMLAVLSGTGCAALLARLASAKPTRDWKASECWLLAGLALTMLSLNSTNVYTWPLATMWYIPILLATVFFGIVAQASWRVIGASTFFLGVLLDEFSFPVIISAVAALVLSRSCTDWSKLRRIAAAIGVGLVLSRGFYWACDLAAQSTVVPATRISRSLVGLTQPELWKGVLLPLSDSVVHVANLQTLFGGHSGLVQWACGLALLAAHGWFWWRVASVPAPGRSDYAAATYMAVAVMLLFYALVAGIVMQRVPQHGFDYLHQPRYVLFYQLNLAALALLLYREVTHVASRQGAWRYCAAGAMALILVFGVLQVRLSSMAWAQVKYVSRYYEQTAHDMGTLAGNPDAELKCLDPVRVCEYPVEKRRRIMSLLVRHRLNLFSPDFQALHRLYPEKAPVVDTKPAAIGLDSAR